MSMAAFLQHAASPLPVVSEKAPSIFRLLNVLASPDDVPVPVSLLLSEVPIQPLFLSMYCPPHLLRLPPLPQFFQLWTVDGSADGCPAVAPCLLL
jgi:hypothetical protein